MLAHINLQQVLFLDIETVPQYQNFEEMPEYLQKLWDKKSSGIRKETSVEEFYNKAGIWAEFGKIVCISIARIKFDSNTPQLRIKSFFGSDEKEILTQFLEILNKLPQKVLLCAHNGKDFDFPYICRRLLINALPIPSILNITGKKPWEINHLDTLELWRFGDFKHYISLDLLANILGIESPKAMVDGSMVKDLFYLEKDLEKIANYCQLDVQTIAQILLKLKGKPLIKDYDIEIVK